MTDRLIKTPGPDHPITIEPNPKRVVITLRGVAIADTRNALTLKEAKYPDVQYIPRGDVDMTQLTRTDHSTYCPFKGDCSYYDLPGGDEQAANSVWTYEAPFPAVSTIKDHLAFYADRVEIAQSE